MRKFLKDINGAVTVFISLLLIPAILISGTAVDLARIHSARSILQDANQLAANSVLTQYNALLQDLYGLFGIADDDPILAKLLDDYIAISVFGESTGDRSLGTLQVFYGSDLSLEDPMLSRETGLDDVGVLRRQIEEYMKFRGPVIIVKEILEVLDNNNLKADKEVIENKSAIDSDVLLLYNKYKELYAAIVAADKCILPIGGISGGHFGTVSSHLKLIRGMFLALQFCYAEWETLMALAPSNLAEDKLDLESKYRAIMENIKALVIGGPRGSNWAFGGWTKFSGNTGLESHIEGAKENGEKFKPKFDTVVRIAKELDAMHGELSRKIDEFEQKLYSGECSDELRIALTEKSGSPSMSLIERYREILRWDDITQMANVYRDGGYDYIDNIFKPMLDGVSYRDKDRPYLNLTLDQLQNLSSNSGFSLNIDVPSIFSRTADYGNIPEDNVGYSMPLGFKKFAEHPGENAPFFEALKAMEQQPSLDAVKLFEGQDDASGDTGEEKQRDLIQALLELVDSAYRGLSNNPLGAMHINDNTVSSNKNLGILDILVLIPEAMNEPNIATIEDPKGSMSGFGDNILLLTYAMSMFSNYATTKPGSFGATKDDLTGINFTKSLTGIPMSPRINYFYQSEWEYLYHGSQNAGENLSAITRLLFLVRLVCNYITVFSVKEVTTIVTNIQATFAWCPPIGLLLGELARAAFAAAESVVDVAALRSGHKVPLFKNVSANEWICSPSGVLSAVSDVISVEKVDETAFKNDKGLTYVNYTMFFFVTKTMFDFTGAASDLLAERVGNLIEWNMINYEKSINADETMMSAALASADSFRLNKMITGFGLTTTANMRMLFLSMPLAQRGLGGVIPPATFPINATDYRGY